MGFKNVIITVRYEDLKTSQDEPKHTAGTYQTKKGRNAIRKPLMFYIPDLSDEDIEKYVDKTFFRIGKLGRKNKLFKQYIQTNRELIKVPIDL